DQGFVHRDVKPSNIMLSSEGEVKLLDLGLARFQSPSDEAVDLTGTGQAMGTADYVAPEQVTDSRSVDARADIYSLGCTLFKLLTGTAPFADDQHPTAFAKMTAHVSSDPPSLRTRRADVPARLVKLVDTMLNKNPAARPQFPRSVAEKLSAFTSGANLPALAQLAASLEPNRPETNGQRTSSPSATARTKPFMHRPVPMAAAIGAAFFGLVLGLLMGVVIKIRYPDGTEIEVAAPDGSEVTMTPTSDEPAVGSLPVNKPSPASNNPFSGPLQFALVMDMENPFNSSLAPAIAELQKSKSDGLFITDAGVWYPVNKNVELPTTETADGQRHALVSREQDKRVSWDELQGHIVSVQSYGRGGNRGREIELEFDQTLSNQMGELTRNRLSHRLAIIVDDHIVSAPGIRSEIGNKARITGISSEEAQYIMDLIKGGLVEPMQPSPDVSSDEKEIPVPQLESAPEAATPRGRADDEQVAVPQLKGSAEQKTKNSLRQIGLAFHKFHDVYHQFPGSANHREEARRVSSDKKIHPFSWRVAILPFIEQQELYERYRFDEPWDSEANKKLLEKMPEIYKNPFAPNDQPVGHTNYQGFATGDGALGKDEGVTFADIRDGTSNTLLLIKTKDSVPWTKPQDIEREPEFFDDHPVHLLMVDGSVHSREAIDEDELRKLITRDGGEKVRVDQHSAEQNIKHSLKQIGIALLNFHDTYNKLPASANRLEGERSSSSDEKIYPFSWRVAVLPFIEQINLYEQYNFHEPWDSEANKKLLEKMPEIYKNPFAPSDQPVGHTNYQGFATGDGALGKDEGVTFADIRDGTSNTLLLIKTKDSVPWTKPQDIEREPEFFDDHPVHLLMVDGSVHSREAIDEDELRKLITRDGGEKVRVDQHSAEQNIKHSLKQIGIALLNFHDTYNKLPASANRLEGERSSSSDEKIYPFSWRVAVLPFIEQINLYEQYNFHEPWDSEANKKLLEKMPEIYKNPFAPSDQPVGDTNYQGFATGDGALGKDEGVTFADIRDGASNTLLLIETKDSVPWTKPQDIEGKPEFFDDHPIHILMADGSVHSQKTIDRVELRKLITRDGGEPVNSLP
ncbi:MAG: DUF1559 domain-containing protein, partial [Candidatus Paceibacterota bacterium]